MKKKIIFITKALWIGGIETALINLLNNFDYKRYDVTLLVISSELTLKNQIHPKCRLLVVDRDKRISFKAAYPFNKLFHMTEEAEHPSKVHRAMMWMIPAVCWIENRLYIRYIRNLMKDEQFDTAIIYSDVAAETGIRAIKANKYLMFYHHGAMRHVYHDEIAYKKCEKIIAVSQNQADELKKFVPQYAKKIIAIQNLTDAESIIKRGKLICEDSFNHTKFNIVTVGRMSYEKGMDMAVYACAKLVEEGFTQICWWIVGGGPFMQEVQEIVSRCRMEEYVNLVGMKDNPYPYICQADLYVQPSRIESFGLTIMEALILGKPVVSTNTFGAKEIIRDNSNGILCGISAKALARAVKDLIMNQNILIEISDHSVAKQCEYKNRELILQLESLL